MVIGTVFYFFFIREFLVNYKDKKKKKTLYCCSGFDCFQAKLRSIFLEALVAKEQLKQGILGSIITIKGQGGAAVAVGVFVGSE